MQQGRSCWDCLSGQIDSFLWWWTSSINTAWWRFIQRELRRISKVDLCVIKPDWSLPVWWGENTSYLKDNRLWWWWSDREPFQWTQKCWLHYFLLLYCQLLPTRPISENFAISLWYRWYWGGLFHVTIEHVFVNTGGTWWRLQRNMGYSKPKLSPAFNFRHKKWRKWRGWQWRCHVWTAIMWYWHLVDTVYDDTSILVLYRLSDILIHGKIIFYWYTLRSSNKKQKLHTTNKYCLQIFKSNKLYTYLVFFLLQSRTLVPSHQLDAPHRR